MNKGTAHWLRLAPLLLWYRHHPDAKPRTPAARVHAHTHPNAALMIMLNTDALKGERGTLTLDGSA